VEYADYQLFTHSVIFIVLLLCFNVCVMIPSGHMTSMTPVHPGEGSSSVLSRVLHFFSPKGSKVRDVYVYRL